MSVRTRVARRRRKNFIKLLTIKEWPMCQPRDAFAKSSRYCEMMREIQEIYKKHFCKLPSPFRFGRFDIFYSRECDMTYMMMYTIGTFGKWLIEYAHPNLFELEAKHKISCNSLTQFTSRLQFSMLKSYSIACKVNCKPNNELIYSEAIADEISQIFENLSGELHNKIATWRDEYECQNKSC